MLICNVCHEEHERNEQNHIYSYVNEVVTTAIEELHCTICLYPLQQPTDTPCGHTFCAACIKQSVRIKQHCPNCRKPLLFSDLRPSTVLVRNMLNKLRVSCPVCQEILSRQQLEPHLAKDCPNVEVRCKYADNGCTVCLPQTIIETHNAVCEFQHRPAGTELAPVRDFPNMFHRDEQFEDLPDDQCVDTVLASPDVKNLYMFIEAVEQGEKLRHFNADTLQQVVETKQARGWCTVEPSFLDGLYWLANDYPDTLTLIKGCKELVSGTGSVKIVCVDYTNLRDLVMEEKMYKFYFQHPNIRCSNPTQCGFIVKVSPVSDGNPDSFNIQLVTNPALYPAGIHCHSSVISAENMHLAVEQYTYSGFSDNWCNARISWCGRPEYEEEGEVIWGGWPCEDWQQVRLAVYYNFTK